MGCNAWNHSPDCDCGWGGDTGGGGRGIAFLTRSIRVPDGRDWARPNSPTYETFINPNARCPICGADVFFYASPFGGRVFFDSLGPPWPKHPCTDTYLRRLPPHPVLPPARAPGSRALPSLRPGEWNPLIATQTTRVNNSDKIRLKARATRLPSLFLYVPAGFVDDRPCYWRRAPHDPGTVEISSVSIDAAGAIKEEIISVFSWIRDDEHLASLRDGDGPDPAALNAIGWSLSFGHRTEDLKWYEAQGVDLRLAKSYFAAAAEQGYWAAWNNLGVLARDGLIEPPDEERAFECFGRAAQERNPIPIRHLADCYRNGVGVTKDPDQATFLDKLALSLEGKTASPGL